MKKLILILSINILMLSLAIPTMAKPVAVTFYPDGAKITEQAEFGSKDGPLSALTFTLPITADPNTLSISLESGTSLADLAFERVNVPETAPAAEIKAQIDKLELKKNAAAAELEAIDAQLAFWNNPSSIEKTSATEAVKYAKTIGQEVDELARATFPLKKQVEKFDKEIKLLKQKLDQITAQNGQAWQVTANISPAAKQISARYSYMVNRCSFRPFYSLNADVGAKSVDFTFRAELRQSTGLVLNNVNVALATIRPRGAVNPPNIMPWVIAPVSDTLAQAPRVANFALKAMPEAAMATGAVTDDFTPTMTTKATYALWELGKMTIRPGENPKVTVRKEKWPAEFTWLCRPSMTNRVFLRAAVKYGKTWNYPAGQAVYQVENTMAGKSTFSLADKEATLFFGADPMVTAKQKYKARQAGEKGIIGTKQTYLWDYDIIISNQHHEPVNVRVEEPMPQVRDERIKLTTKFSPEPEDKTKDHEYIWNIKAAAGKETNISCRVQLEAPEDMDLNLGVWR